MIEFPCKFPIKIIFKNEQAITDKVIAILYKHYPKLSPDSLIQKVSNKNNYCSLTVTVLAQNKNELDALYQELSSTAEIKMVL